MSYRVDYNPEMKNRYPSMIKIEKKLPVRPILLSIAAIAFCYGIFCSGVLRFLIPGDPAVTTAAFSEMVDDIGAGESVRQAFLSFCKEIIINAS